MNQFEHETKSKAQAFNSIMRHPKLSKVYSEAIDAPIGSTKRKQAQSMLAVMNKVHSRTPMGMDATGGSGFEMPMPNSTAAFAPTTPPPRVGSSNYNGIFSSMGGGKIIIPASPSAYVAPQVATSSESDFFAQRSTSMFAPINKGNPFGSPGSVLAGTYSTPTSTPSKQNPFFSSPGSIIGSTQASPFVTEMMKYGTPPEAGTASSTPATPNYGGYSSLQEQSAASGRGENNPDGTRKTAEQMASEKTAGATTGAGASTTGGGTSTDMTGGYKPSNRPGFGRIQDSIDAGTGANFFARKAMSDRDYLKTLFPDREDKDLPMGASLSGQIHDLRKKMWEDRNLDMIENSLASKINAGVSVTSDLQAYIRGRDETVGGIDKMIDGLRETMANSSLYGDPSTMDSFNQYGNYLYLLKGRANQRYADFVTTSVNQFNRELTGLQQNYDSTMGQFNLDLSEETDLLSENFNNMYADLTDLYNNLEAAPAKALNAKILQAQAYPAAVSTTGAAIGSAMNALGYDMTGEEIQKDLDSWTKQYTKKEGGFESGINVADLLTQVHAGGHGTAKGALTFAGNIRIWELNNAKGNPKERAAVIAAIHRDMDSTELAQSQGLEPGAGADAFLRRMEIVMSSTETGSSIDANVDVWKEAVAGLKKFWGGMVPKAEWIKTFGDRIPSAQLDAVWNQAALKYKDKESLKQFVGSVEDENFIETIKAMRKGLQ